jgi:hyperosmotically inducible periplasmic protein
MRHLGLFLMGSLALAACASNNTPPAESSHTVAAATNEPNHGPDFAPASSDGLATAPRETRSSANVGAGAAATGTTATNGTQPAPNLDAPRDQREAADRTTANAAAAPTDRTSAPSTATNTGTANTGTANTGTSPDNSKVNTRDRSSAALTPMDQGGSESDRKITQQIRQELMKDGSLSFTAKNVKVITVNGRVTLRGPVKTEAERSSVEAAARRAAGSGAQVDSQLEISK